MKTRIISAIVAALIIIPLVIIGGYPYIIGVSILAILAYKEILDLKKSHGRIPNLIVLLGLVGMLIVILSNTTGFSISYGVTYQRLLLLFLFFILPVVFLEKEEYTTRDAFYMLGVTVMLGFVFNLFIVMRMRGLNHLIYLVTVPMFTDIFAYFGGMLCGKNKLCPSISPKKTWEGSIIGGVIGSVAGIIVYKVLFKTLNFKIILMSIVLSIVGQLGDLVMSKVKRENGIKDFSNIMPGHGGILDRFDSLIFVLITYVVFIFWI